MSENKSNYDPRRRRLGCERCKRFPTATPCTRPGCPCYDKNETERQHYGGHDRMHRGGLDRMHRGGHTR